MVVGGGGGLEQFSVSPRPLGFGFGTKRFGAKGVGPGLDNIRKKDQKLYFPERIRAQRAHLAVLVQLKMFACSTFVCLYN